MVYEAIDQLVQYGETKQLICKEDAVFTRNRLLEILGLPGKAKQALPQDSQKSFNLQHTLFLLVDDACKRNWIKDTQGNRDLLDTKIMGALTPLPSIVADQFRKHCAVSPAHATDAFYTFSQDVNYIRTDRIAKDIRWQTETEYGALDITINMSKPEKDPRDIAAAKSKPSSGYPACLLCKETEGYAGRTDFPARQNHRIIPISLCEEAWGFQYSPYVYYNQHCIVLNQQHIPMVIEPRTFALLFDFIRQFPHFFIGSNADLPIVGGSILSHEHFQGGNYHFPMAKAPVEHAFPLPAYPGVTAGTVKWPMSVIRLRSKDTAALSQAASHILAIWQQYSDQAVGIFAFSNEVAHNTITPITRFREGQYEIDLVLRNNRTSEEHPLGIFHPHQPYHHIKKENIGLIEVMGMAILPARLRQEFADIADTLQQNKPCTVSAHAKWAEALKQQYAAKGMPLHTMDAAQIDTILRDEAGRVFCRVLENCGVFKRDESGRAAFQRLIDFICA